MDFHGNSIECLCINGVSFLPYEIKFLKQKVCIPVDLLKLNETNTIKIKFTNTCTNNSVGLARYQDPVDNEIYMYTHLEPFNCNRWFPCFDQPCLRAKLTLTVISPVQNWKVIANGKETLRLSLEQPEA